MPVRSKSWVIIIGLILIFTWANPAIGSSIKQLEKLANSDFIPEVRKAASKALAKKYIDQKLLPEELTRVAGTARTDQLLDAVTKALTRRYEDAKRVGSLEEAIKKAEELEKKVKAGESPAVTRAASSALSFYYLAFNLNDVKGYSMEKLEEIATAGKVQGLKEAATTALESIYPNYYSAEELIDLINSSSPVNVKHAAAGALAIRYSSQMPPNPDISELKDIAADPKKNEWLREAAGKAFGKLAHEKIKPEELEELTLRGNTAEIRGGAAAAWSRYLIDSDKTKGELLRMACAATGFAPEAYSSAVITALADRMLKTEASIRGG